MDVYELLNKQLTEKEVGISWLNKYSATLIKTSKNTILFDPVNLDTKLLDSLNIDILIVTHEHFDHLDRNNLSYILTRQQPYVIATPPPSRWARGFMKDQDYLYVVKPTDTIELNGVKITVFKGNHPCGTPATFLIKCENGTKIYHAVDSTIFEELKVLKEENIDVAIVPIGIAPGTSPHVAKEMVRFIEPKVAIPHHGTIGFEEFKELVEKMLPNVKVIILKQLEAFIYTRD